MQNSKQTEVGRTWTVQARIDRVFPIDIIPQPEEPGAAFPV
ncbi:MAG: hypothetical protein ACLVF5_09255 [Lachnospiraceae bacterium]|nr:hypothetical protein [Clostridiales bacterium]MEE0223349.1 hypothetical protein [Acutalibacteraceae bacterium]